MSTPRALALLALLLGLVTAPSQAAVSDAPISVSVASLFIGEEKIVEGRVTAAERDGNVVRLHLGSAPQTLTVSLIISLLNDFPPHPEQHYLGQTVQVVGTLRDFRNHVEMTLRDAAGIRVVGAVAAPLSPPSSAQSEPAMQRRIDGLNDRVRGLEGRLQQLEHPTAPQ